MVIIVLVMNNTVLNLTPETLACLNLADAWADYSRLDERIEEQEVFASVEQRIDFWQDRLLEANPSLRREMGFLRAHAERVAGWEG